MSNEKIDKIKKVRTEVQNKIDKSFNHKYVQTLVSPLKDNLLGKCPETRLDTGIEKITRYRNGSGYYFKIHQNKISYISYKESSNGVYEKNLQTFIEILNKYFELSPELKVNLNIPLNKHDVYEL